MKYLGLDAVWWLVSPGNPLKTNSNLPTMHIRADMCRTLIKNPHIIVSTIEKDLGTTRTFDTIAALQSSFSGTDFIWLSGTDIVYEFQRWYKWRQLAKSIPFAFIGRPTKDGVVRNNAFYQINGLKHTYLTTGARPPLKKGRIYWLFGENLNPTSSTLLRNSSDTGCGLRPKEV